MEINDRPIIVSIWCLTYNHEKYIRQCLDGFVMQKTNFRFEAIVHDDASTDGTADIVREYAEKYPDIIKPIIETENQYSKQDGSLYRIMQKTCTGKYIALCEGDDYWSNSLKLQKQVDFLEQNPDFSMCCSDGQIITNEGEISWTRYKSDSEIKTEEMIRGGGPFILTASILHRTDIMEDYPDCCKKCHIGDYPLQVFCALKGRTFYMSEKMVAYRYMSAGSWTSSYLIRPVNSFISGWRSEVDMLQGLDSFSHGTYHDVFHKVWTNFIHGKLLLHSDQRKVIESHFQDVISHFKWIYIIEDLLMKLGCRRLAYSCFYSYNKAYKVAIANLPIVNKFFQKNL